MHAWTRVCVCVCVWASETDTHTHNTHTQHTHDPSGAHASPSRHPTNYFLAHVSYLRSCDTLLAVIDTFRAPTYT